MALTITQYPTTYTTGKPGAGVRPVRMLGASDVRVVFAKAQWDSSYASGGLALSPSSLGLVTILAIFASMVPSGGIGSQATSAGGGPAVGCAFDATNNKLLAINLSAGVEYPNAANLSYQYTYFLAVGY